MDRASVFGTECWGFESLLGRHFFTLFRAHPAHSGFFYFPRFISLVSFSALAARSLALIRSLARPPTATKWASWPSSPTLLPQLYITHKSTHGQRYRPSPPGPLPRTAGEGLNVDLPVLCSQGYSRDGMRTIAFCCRHDFWVMHSSRNAGEGRTAVLTSTYCSVHTKFV